MSAEAKLAAFEGLLNEMSTMMADVVQALQEGHASEAEISNTLIEMLGLMQSHKPGDDLAKLVEAIKAIPAPQVHITNQVHPAPVTVQVIRMGGLEFTFDYDKHDRLVRGLALPFTPPKGA